MNSPDRNRPETRPLTLLIAVAVALVTGFIGSLALRPPGQAATADRAAAEVALPRLTWRAASSFNQSTPILGPVAWHVAESLDTLTGGALKLTVYDPGEVVPALEITEAVRGAKIDVGFQWVGYDQGRIPASTLISAVPFGMEPTEFTAWWYHGGGRELGEALYEPHNVMPILCSVIGPETAGWFREPVETLADLEGLKIRFAGLGGKVLQRLGASVTMIPGGEIFQALEKGAIDATEFSMPAVDQRLGFNRVARFNYFPGWHQTFSAFHMQVNLDHWRGLNARMQGILRHACQASVTFNLALAEASQGSAILEFSETGVNTGILPEPILRELMAVAQEVLDDEAARDPMFAQILNSQREFSAVYREWKIRGYLPRTF
ncbi:MAG: TRAP transporter substrate-binding protein [Pseudomonadota bacterium]